jgi:hypothetical protein
VNNDQLKSLLLQVRPCSTEFTLIMSGKKSSKVNGLYKPGEREIILHNKNFESEDELVYTALHEYAHHLHAESRGGDLSPRCHNPEFWAIFHGLLADAEEKNLYRNLFETEEFRTLAERIRSEFLSENGRIMKELGSLMIEAESLCRKRKTRFEDFIDRVLGMSRVTARVTMRLSALDLDPVLGYDSMKIVAGVRDPVKRSEAERSLLAGASPDTVKANLRKRLEDSDPKELLQRERERIKKTIDGLKSRLKEVEDNLKRLEDGK